MGGFTFGDCAYIFSKAASECNRCFSPLFSHLNIIREKPRNTWPHGREEEWGSEEGKGQGREDGGGEGTEHVYSSNSGLD